MKFSVIKASNESISTAGERVLVVGGTQGIGQGIAERFARAGAEVWIVGRNETLANAVLANLNKLGEANKANEQIRHRFFKVDLSLIADTEKLAKEIITEASPSGINHLVLCQGGPPNGNYLPTSEGNDRHYTVQVLSRFVLAYRLTEGSEPTVKNSVVTIMSPGYAISDFDDLELSKARERGKFGILPAGKRDSVVMDAMTLEFSSRVENVRFMHLFPGAVKTEFARNSDLPWYLSGLSAIFLPLVGRTKEDYAEIPFYLMANPKGKELTTSSNTQFWNEKIEPMKAHATTVKAENREKVWKHLMSKLTSS